MPDDEITITPEQTDAARRSREITITAEDLQRRIANRHTQDNDPLAGIQVIPPQRDVKGEILIEGVDYIPWKELMTPTDNPETTRTLRLNQTLDPQTGEVQNTTFRVRLPDYGFLVLPGTPSDYEFGTSRGIALQQLAAARLIDGQNKQ